MRRSMRAALAACIALGCGAQLVPPARTNPPTDPTRTLSASLEVPADAARVLDRGCRDCHTHDTRWPLYSHLAPVSWLVVDHVNYGRRHVKFSEWARYSPVEADRLLARSCRLMREGAMPLERYVWMHPDARMSQADIDAVCRPAGPAVAVDG